MDNIYVAHGLETRIQNVLRIVYNPCNTMSRRFTDLVVKVIVKRCDFFIVVEGFESFKELESSNVVF